MKIAENHWDLIHDFTEKEDGSKNYDIVEPDDWNLTYREIEGIEDKPVQSIPVPKRYGGTIPDDAYFGLDK